MTPRSGRWLHRDALSLLEAVPRFWRRLRGRCLDCGDDVRWWRRQHRDGCPHCSRDRARCHRCNKNRAWMSAYGAPPSHPNCRCDIGSACDPLADDFGRRLEAIARGEIDVLGGVLEGEW